MPMPKQPKRPGHGERPHRHGLDQHGGRGERWRSARAPCRPPSARSRCGSSRGRDCTYEPSAQVAPPAARESPARVGDSPRWVTSISGTKDSAAMNEPAATPRSRTTDGSPRAARYGPRRQQPAHGGHEQRGTGQRRAAGRATAGPGRRTGAAPRPPRSPSASRMRRRSNGSAAASASAAPPAIRRIAGSARASGRRMRTGMPTNTQRHPRCSVTVPEASGPTTDGTTQAAENAGHDRRPQPLGVGPPDDDVQRDDHQPAADALDGPPQDEHPHARPRSRRAAARPPKAPIPVASGGERPAPVGPLPGEHHGEEAGGEVRGERERVERDAVQLAGRDRHRRTDGGRLEGDEQDDGDDADAERPVGPPEDAFAPVRRRRSRRWRR